MMVELCLPKKRRTSSTQHRGGQLPPAAGSEFVRPPARSLRRNLFFAALGHGVYAASQWGMIAGLAKLGTPEDVGHFALCLALTTPVVEFTGLQLHVVQATDARGRHPLDVYLSVRIATGVIALALIVALTVLWAKPHWFVITAVTMATAKVIEGITLICYGRFQREERLEWVARSQLLRGPASVVALCGAFYLTGSLTLAVAGLVFVWTAVCLAHDVPVARGLTYPPEQVDTRLPAMLDLILVSLPLGVAVGLNTLSANLPRYFVDGYLGARDLGIFSALAYVGIGARLFYLPLIHTIMPRLAHLQQRGDWRAFHRLIVKSLAGALVISLGVLAILLVFGRLLLQVVYTTEYAEYHGILIILTFGTLIHFFASVLIAGLQALRNFPFVLACYAGGIIALVIALPIGLSHAGLVGAALATVIGSTAELTVAAIALRGVTFVREKGQAPL